MCIFIYNSQYVPSEVALPFRFGLSHQEPCFAWSILSHPKFACFLNIFYSLWHRNSPHLHQHYTVVWELKHAGLPAYLEASFTIWNSFLWYQELFFLSKISVLYFIFSWRITSGLVSQSYAIIQQNPLTCQ